MYTSDYIMGQTGSQMLDNKYHIGQQSSRTIKHIILDRHLNTKGKPLQFTIDRLKCLVC